MQYAELMDFCYVWLRLALRKEFREFRGQTTRSQAELTGNVTLGRNLDHFTKGLSEVFCRYASALKPDAPFVFTYHHNDSSAYVPLIVAILDAGLDCTATLPAAAEMSASLHIAGTGSSVLDSIFVCRRASARKRPSTRHDRRDALVASLNADAEKMRDAGLRLSAGDLRCLAAGHLARFVVNALVGVWDRSIKLERRMASAKDLLGSMREQIDLDAVFTGMLAGKVSRRALVHQTAWLPGL